MGLLAKATALAAMIFCLGAAQAQGPRPVAAPELAISPAEQALLQEVARRGALIYAYDQAAWHGTDAMVAKLPDYQNRVGGWIVDGPADAPELTFFDTKASRPAFTARFRDGKLVSSEVAGAAAGELSASRRQLIAARQAALDALAKSAERRCSEAAMNSVVLPPAAPGEPTLVYVLTPQRVMDALPFGGHFLIPVDPSGRTGSIRRFTNSCLEISLKGPRKDEHPISLGVTHLLDSVPTEIHVFSSLAARMPVVVGTNDGRIWSVNGREIELIGKD